MARTVEVLKTEEKGSDVNLATYMLVDGFKAAYDVAVVVSNDSDLKEPILAVQRELSLRVGVVITDPNMSASALPADFHRRLRKRALAASQLPPVLTDPRGSIRKPQGW
ncbi:MAG TPA: NYN domain-containing protein [Actinomycetota bacterium]